MDGKATCGNVACRYVQAGGWLCNEPLTEAMCREMEEQQRLDDFREERRLSRELGEK